MISVIVPVYNVEKYLDRCIESIINQTYQNIEIILVDDGSPDNCPHICDEWAKKDHRIKVLHKENGGLSSARNAGLNIAKGEYISFVDSDDYIHCEMYEKMLEKIFETKSDIATCGRYLMFENGKIKKMHSNKEYKTFTPEQAINELLTNGLIEEAAWDKLYKRDLFKNLYFPVGEINEDIVIMPEILRRCQKICHIGDAYYYYCLNGSSITRSAYNEKKRVTFLHLLDLQKFIFNYFPSLINSLHVLEAKSSITTLYLLEENDIKVKFKDDYNYVNSLFRRTFKYYLLCKNFSFGDKFKAMLIYLNLYTFVRNLKKIIKPH